MITYERSAKKTNVWKHWPDDCCQVRNVKESCSIPLHEEGDYGVPKEVEDHKTKVVEDNSSCMAWGRVGKRSILFENYEGLESCENTTEKSKEAKVVVDICCLFYQVFLQDVWAILLLITDIITLQTWKQLWEPLGLLTMHYNQNHHISLIPLFLGWLLHH